MNTTSDGCAFTVTARYEGVYVKSLLGGGGFFPRTGVLEVIDDEDGDTETSEE